MAGDWIKIEKATMDKPEVFEMAEYLKIDPDAIAGKLMRVWGWFDDHSEDGSATVTVRALLDRLTGVTGFTDSMEAVGWLLIESGQMRLPNFNRHNGQTAKNRCSTNRRMAKSRTKENKCDDSTVTNVTADRNKCDDSTVTNVTTGRNKNRNQRREEKRRVKKEAIASCPASPDVLAELWAGSPKASRERSSHKQVADAWTKIKVGDRPSIETLCQALEAWKTTKKWRDGFSEGLHLWITNRQWENIPTPEAETPSGTRVVQFGGRTGKVIKIES